MLAYIWDITFLEEEWLTHYIFCNLVLYSGQRKNVPKSDRLPQWRSRKTERSAASERDKGNYDGDNDTFSQGGKWVQNRSSRTFRNVNNINGISSLGCKLRCGEMASKSLWSISQSAYPEQARFSFKLSASVTLRMMNQFWLMAKSGIILFAALVNRILFVRLNGKCSTFVFGAQTVYSALNSVSVEAKNRSFKLHSKIPIDSERINFL